MSWRLVVNSIMFAVLICKAPETAKAADNRIKLRDPVSFHFHGQRLWGALEQGVGEGFDFCHQS